MELRVQGPELVSRELECLLVALLERGDAAKRPEQEAIALARHPSCLAKKASDSARLALSSGLEVSPSLRPLWDRVLHSECLCGSSAMI